MGWTFFFSWFIISFTAFKAPLATLTACDDVDSFSKSLYFLTHSLSEAFLGAEIGDPEHLCVRRNRTAKDEGERI